MTFHQAHWLLALHKTYIGKEFNGKFIKDLIVAPIRHEKIMMIAHQLFNKFCPLETLCAHDEFDVIIIYDHLGGITNRPFLTNAYISFFSFFNLY